MNLLRGPSSLYKTYAIHSPVDVQIKSVCEDVGCEAFIHGWETTIDESTDLGDAQARYIRETSRRTFREMRTAGLTVFRFEPGQRCFADHHTRPELYTLRPGDPRSWQGEAFRHQRGIDWVEDFVEHQEKIADQLAKG